MSLDTLNRVNYDKFTDGPDALPVGTAREFLPAARIAFGLDIDMELYLMRTRPELYHDWMRDAVEDRRAKAVRAVNKHLAELGRSEEIYDWDCSGCKSAVVTGSLDDACPRCGRP